jgi:integrase
LCSNQVAPFIGDIELQKLKAIDIEEWHGVLLTSGRRNGEGGLSRMTVRHAHALLSKCLAEAVRHELLVRNVAALQPPPRVADEAEEIVILDAVQARDVVNKLKRRAIYPKAILALTCGLRRGEILALHWRDIDFDRRTVTVRVALEETKAGGVTFKKPKTRDGARTITLPDLTVEVLRDHRKRELETRFALGRGKLTGTDLLFTRVDGVSPQSPHALSAEWRKAAESIGLGAVTLHALRHTHASHLIAHGVDVVKIAKRLGHSDAVVTLSVYAHWFAKLEDKSAEAVNAAVAELASA